MISDSDLTLNIKQAVKTIEAFNKRQESVKGLQKIISYMKAFFGETLSHEEILKAIEILKKNYFAITKLNTGTEQQQSLAFSALSAINKFNSFIDQSKNNNPSRSFFSRNNFFIPTFPKIDFTVENLQKNFKHLSFEDLASTNESLSKFFSASTFSNYLPPFKPIHNINGQAAELFYMKAIALIEKNIGLTHLEARCLLKDAVVSSQLDDDKATCRIRCHVAISLDKKLNIAGSFLSDTKGHFTIPKIDQFSITFE